MTPKEEIELTFKKYLEATFTQDFDALYSLLYEYDIEEFRNRIVDFARQMDEFGETREFLDQLGVSSLQKLEKMTLSDFMQAIFRLTTRKIGAKNLKKVIAETTITGIEETDFYSIVSYEYPIQVFDDWEMHKGKCQMIKSHKRWLLFFRSGLEAGLSCFQQEIDSYLERKERDKPENLNHEGDLAPFSITGYRDYLTGKVVIEPRFKHAGDFSQGLAFVQIMNKYGYIHPTGEIAIKPQFSKAKDFSEKLAAVKLPMNKEEERWGFIDQKGKIIVKPAYHSTSRFSEGLCAVLLDGKWGYIDQKGNMVIPVKFDMAGDFEDGAAEVKLKSKNSDTDAFTIDTKGNILKVD